VAHLFERGSRLIAMGNSRRLKRAMKAKRTRERTGGGYGGVKMSEVLLEFAEPLVDHLSLPEDREAFVAALKIAGLLWNEAVCPRPGGRTELYTLLNTAIGAPRDPVMEDVFDAMIARGRLLYPGLDRLVTAVDAGVEDDGRCTVRVMSAV
jgi:hypothetical protein